MSNVSDMELVHCYDREGTQNSLFCSRATPCQFCLFRIAPPCWNLRARRRNHTSGLCHPRQEGPQLAPGYDFGRMALRNRAVNLAEFFTGGEERRRQLREQ